MLKDFWNRGKLNLEQILLEPIQYPFPLIFVHYLANFYERRWRWWNLWFVFFYYSIFLVSFIISFDLLVYANASQIQWFKYLKLELWSWSFRPYFGSVASKFRLNYIGSLNHLLWQIRLFFGGIFSPTKAGRWIWSNWNHK